MTGRWRAGLAGLALAGLAALAAVVDGGGAVAALRERALDAALGWSPPPASDAVTVVDIDQASLAAEGPWPWPRERLAALVERVADGAPVALALDILLEGPDRSAPESLARALAARSGDMEAAAAVARLPDPDARLAAALARAPVVLAALLGPASGDAPAPAPIALSGPPPALAPWRAQGAALPFPPLRRAAREVAAASLGADGDGVLRRAPLFALAGDQPLAGLAVAAVRLREGAALYVLDGGAGRLRIGGVATPLAAEASLRFRPTGPECWKARSLSAADVLAGRVAPDRFAGRIVLIGGSAPALGALRRTAASAIAPSVQIHADAVETLLSGAAPVRPDGAGRAEAAAAVVLALAAAGAGALAGPALAAVATLGLAGMWAGGALAALSGFSLALDPASPALAALLSGGGAGLVAAVDARRRAAALRRRFESHLAPAVVERIARNPELLKLAGERREVTALFTDVEGFTAFAEAHPAEAVVGALDRYFDGVTAIVTAHGGMVDKLVGDAAHALFNAPLDLENHAEQAVRAALAIAAFSEAFRAAPDMAALGFGRTRVGVETGLAVVGDVGSRAKLDYTAHGGAVNTAARLEALNKPLGTAVCVGPVARARVSGVAFRAHGAVELRGLGRIEVYEPLPG